MPPTNASQPAVVAGNCRPWIESALGRPLPFDDEVLAYLLKVAAVSDKREFQDLVADFCPSWGHQDHSALATELAKSSRDFHKDVDPEPGGGSSSAAPAGGGYSRTAKRQAEEDMAEQDRLFALQLQEEEERAAREEQSTRATGGKKQKKTFRPLNINYTVGNQAAQPALGTAAPSNLADMLRNRRSAQARNNLHPESFGPPAVRHPRSAAAPQVPPEALGGLTWAERAQVAAEKASADEALAAQTAAAAAVVPAPVQSRSGGGRAGAGSGPRAAAGAAVSLRILTTSGTDYQVNVMESETIAEVKQHVERDYNMSAGRQRLLFSGRELQDTQRLCDSGWQPGKPLHLALRSDYAPPPRANDVSRPAPATVPGPLPNSAWTRRGDELKLRLRLPGGTQGNLDGLHDTTSISDVKYKIQLQYGIRADHMVLSFFGTTLEDDMSLAESAIANGAAIDIALAPPPAASVRAAAPVRPEPTPPGAPGLSRPAGSGRPLIGLAANAGNSRSSQTAPSRQQQDFASLQASGHGRVLDEDEALQLALAASEREAAIASNVPSAAAAAAAISSHAAPEHVELDDDAGLSSLEDEDGAESSQNVEFHTDVSIQDQKLAPLISHAQRVASMNFNEDFINKVSKRSGYRLALLAEKGKKVKTILGYTVYRFRKKVLNVMQIGAAGDNTRGRVPLRKLVIWLVEQGKKANVEHVAVSCMPGNVLFFQSCGFKKTEQPMLEGEEPLDGQVVLEYKCKGKGAVAKQTPAPSRPDGPTVPQRPVASQPAASSTAIPSAQLTRGERIRAIFKLCDRNNDGRLSKDEMLTFAQMNGFDENTSEWEDEFMALCEEKGVDHTKGISEHMFIALIDDQSDAGCWCTDEELRHMLDKLKADRGVEPEAEAQPAQAADSEPPPIQDRHELVYAIFHACDLDCDGYLNEQEMHLVAHHTGFEGNTEDWAQEFSALCAEFGVPGQGVDLRNLERLFDDSSDDGCYCTDEELNAMLTKVRAKIEKEFVSKPPEPQADTGGTGGATGAAQADGHGRNRAELVEALFFACDLDGDGRLNSAEMREFANHTGFDGDAASWATEYEHLCREFGGTPNGGIDKKIFARLVNDASDAGCYCTDEELEHILRQFPDQKRHQEQQAQQQQQEEQGQQQQQQQQQQEQEQAELAAERTMLPSEAGRIQAQPAAPRQASTPAPASVPGSRAKLIREVFQAYDKDCNGLLGVGEMRQFANSTGFEGTDREWGEEFALLCSEHDVDPALGFDLDLFSGLVNDESDTGQYCSDSELRAMLENASAKEPGAGRASQDPVTAKGESTVADIAAQCPANATGATSETRASTAGRTREELVEMLFERCDLDGDGYLSCSEMQKVASGTGFEGTAEEWETEFQLLCQEQGVPTMPGLAMPILAQLLNDNSDAGCYCSDSELSLIVQGLPPPVAKPVKPASDPRPAVPDVAAAAASPPAAGATTTNGAAQPQGKGSGAANSGAAKLPNLNSRPELVQAVFRALNADKSGALKVAEMKAFAMHSGFEGDDQQWQEEFDMLCTEHGREPAVGVDFELFQELVDDQSVEGCYCSDDELRAMLRDFFKDVHSRTAQNVAAKAAASPPAAAASEPRAPLLRRLFNLLDVDGDGTLSCQEMAQFARWIGFVGDDAVWRAEYDALLEEHKKRPGDGIDIELFGKLADDASEAGCYCTDTEMENMIAHLESKADEQQSNVDNDWFLVQSSDAPHTRPPPGLPPPPPGLEKQRPDPSAPDRRPAGRDPLAGMIGESIGGGSSSSRAPRTTASNARGGGGVARTNADAEWAPSLAGAAGSRGNGNPSRPQAAAKRAARGSGGKGQPAEWQDGAEEQDWGGADWWQCGADEASWWTEEWHGENWHSAGEADWGQAAWREGAGESWDQQQQQQQQQQQSHGRGGKGLGGKMRRAGGGGGGWQ